MSFLFYFRRMSRIFYLRLIHIKNYVDFIILIQWKNIMANHLVLCHHMYLLSVWGIKNFPGLCFGKIGGLFKVIKRIVICERRNKVNQLWFLENQELVCREWIHIVWIWFFDRSGKTESAKYVLQYLTESYGTHSGQIEDRINKCESYLICVIHIRWFFFSESVIRSIWKWYRELALILIEIWSFF